MAFNVEDIKDYVDENASELIAKLLGGHTSAQALTIQTGVKSNSAINILTTDAAFQDGKVAGWTPNGTTKLSQRIITVGDVKIQEGLNPKDINATYLQHEMSGGSYEDGIPFEQIYAEKKISEINAKVEKAIWQGDRASSDVNLNKWDGFLKIIDAESTVVSGNTSNATVIDKSNVIDLVQDMYNVLDVDCLEKTDLKLAMGYDTARLYTAAHKDLDLRNYSPIAGGKFEFVIPGTNVTAFATSGLNGTNRMVLASKENMVIGTDMENDLELFKMFYSVEEFIVKFHAEFKKGCQVAFPEQIVEFTLGA